MIAIILAAGRGSRLKPLTNTIPKALVPIGDQTLIEKVIFSLPNKIDTVIIVTKHLGFMIEEKIGNNFDGKKVIYQKQQDDIEGTWAAFISCKSLIETDDLFMVINSDDLFKKNELGNILELKKIGIGITETLMPASYYGIDVNLDGTIAGFRKHSNANSKEKINDWFANGFYVLTKKVFNFEPVLVGGGEYGLPQTLFKNLDHYPLQAFEIKYWQSCNVLEDLNKIELTLPL